MSAAGRGSQPIAGYPTQDRGRREEKRRAAGFAGAEVPIILST